MIGIRAVCHLEFGNVLDPTIANWNDVKVIRHSDTGAGHNVGIDSYVFQWNSSNYKTIPAENIPFDNSAVSFTCNEFDYDGADCTIYGQILCESDNEPEYNDIEGKEITEVKVDCHSISNNNGCTKEITCDKAGDKILAAKAACNLDWGTVSYDQHKTVDWNEIQTFRKSDTGVGSCRITDGTLNGAGTTYWESAHFAGSVAQVGRFTGTKASFHCNEQDYDGADCHIVGSICGIPTACFYNHVKMVVYVKIMILKLSIHVIVLIQVLLVQIVSITYRIS